MYKETKFSHKWKFNSRNMALDNESFLSLKFLDFIEANYEVSHREYNEESNSHFS